MTQDIALYLGPSDWGAPDDLLPIALEVIAQASDELVLATQQLSHPSIVDALVDARRRGLRVRVISERDYIRESRATYNIWIKGGSREEGRQALMALLRGSINVRIERRSRLLHNNFIVVDPAKKKDAKVISTSANLTVRGFHRNLNHLIVIKDQAMSQVFMSEFDSIWNDELSSPHPADPPEIEVDGMHIKVVFGPEHGPEMELTKQIAKAQQKVCFSVSSFSKTSGVDDSLLAKLSAGVEVRGLLDDTQARLWWSATDSLEQGGAELFFTEKGLPIKLHHKMMLVDDSLLMIGTNNYSSAGARLNEEVMFLIWPTDRKKNTFVTYARKEVDRVMKNFSVPSNALIWG